MTTDPTPEPTDTVQPGFEEFAHTIPDHGPAAAVFADEADLPDVDPDELEKLLGVFCSGWISGYVSCAISAARQHGVVDDESEMSYAVMVEHQAGHVMQSMLGDPIARHQVLTGLRHRLNGNPTRGIITITCSHDHAHEHGEECGS